MGMLKGFIQEWLEEYGYEKGYDFTNLPNLEDMCADTPHADEYVHGRWYEVDKKSHRKNIKGAKYEKN